MSGDFAGPPDLSPDAIQGRVLYRDGLILILDKPAGVPVHAGPGGGPNLEASFDALRYGLPRPPALAHRLDRDTSGCLVLGRHPKALRRVGKLFTEGRVDKIYWAIVEGEPEKPSGTIDAPLRKTSRRDKGWRMVVDTEGQRALTTYRTLGSGEGKTWLELRPKTGRTHQVRVHCAELGCPVIGDGTYGQADGGNLLHLHARAIRLPLYPKKDPIAIEAPPPAHMIAALTACGWVNV